MTPEAENFLKDLQTAEVSSFEVPERERLAIALEGYKRWKESRANGRYGWAKVADDIHSLPSLAASKGLREVLKARFKLYATANKASVEKGGKLNLFHPKSLQRISREYGEQKQTEKEGESHVEAPGTWGAIRDSLSS
jgi:hypothetical protein